MVKLDTATAIYVGSTPATKVYMGSTQVWSATPAVTPYNLFPSTVTYPDQAIDSNAYTMGTEFYVNKSGCYITKVRYMQPTVGTLAARTMAVWSTTNGNTGTLVGGPYTMPTPTAGAWCAFNLTTSIALTANTKYRVGCLHPANAGFARFFRYFEGGQTNPGSNQQTFGGYLVLPNNANSFNTSQGSFTASGTLSFPSSAYQYASYYSDIEVVDANPGF